MLLWSTTIDVKVLNKYCYTPTAAGKRLSTHLTRALWTLAHVTASGVPAYDSGHVSVRRRMRTIQIRCHFASVTNFFGIATASAVRERLAAMRVRVVVPDGLVFLAADFDRWFVAGQSLVGCVWARRNSWYLLKVKHKYMSLGFRNPMIIVTKPCIL